MRPGRRHGHVDDGVERCARPSAAASVIHGVHDGAARPLPPVLGVHAHGDLRAVQVVAQRDLHHADARRTDPRRRPPRVGRIGGVAAVLGEGPDVAQAEAGPVGPRVPLDRVQHGVPRRQASSSSPGSSGRTSTRSPCHADVPRAGRGRRRRQRRTAPNSLSTASMQPASAGADLLVGQRALGRAEAQAVRQAAGALVDARRRGTRRRARPTRAARRRPSRRTSATASAG